MKNIKKDKFEKGDYIIDITSNNCIKLGDTGSSYWVYSTSGYTHRYDSSTLVYYTDINTKWRYASKEEIEEYTRLGKYYNINTLNKPIKSTELTSLPEKWIPEIGDWIYITKSDNNWNKEMDKFINKVFQISKSELNRPITEYYKVYFEEDTYKWCWRSDQGHFRKALPHEIPNNDIKKLSKKELLEKARRDYPINTIIKSNTRGSYRIINNDFYYGTTLDQENCIFNDSIFILDDKGKWAEIISKPNEGVIEQYNIVGYDLYGRESKLGIEKHYSNWDSKKILEEQPIIIKQNKSKPKIFTINN